MFIKRVQLRNYRNIEDQVVHLSPETNIIIGQNGQGKTNFVEAIYFQLRGSSFRFAENSDLISSGKESANIDLECSLGNLDYHLKTLITKNQKKQLCNEKPVNSSFLSEKFPIILFSPESLSAIKDGPDLRRQLIDDLLLLIFPKTAHLMADYKKALRTRNKLLKDRKAGLLQEIEFIRLFDAINPTFMTLSGQLASERIKAIREILPDLLNAATKIYNKIVDISVEYVVSGHNTTDQNAEELKELIFKRSKELRPAEVSYGSSLVGPHKHDVKFVYNRKDSRIYCSQGQQRALILAFKLAQIVYHRRIRGEPPIVILDDVLSELDLERRESLIRFLKEMKVQVFVTTADELQSQLLLSDVLGNECRRIEVKEGKFF